jgi:glucose-6-phosphate isomerase
MATDVQVITKIPPAKRTAWKALEAHYRRVRELHLRNLFADDPTRGERMAAHGAGIHLDYSKNRITDQTLKLLIQLAEESGLQTRIDAMFRGEKINTTEELLRYRAGAARATGASIFVDGERGSQVHAVLER